MDAPNILPRVKSPVFAFVSTYTMVVGAFAYDLETEMSEAPKTKSVGIISADKAKKISGFADDAKGAAALTEARQQTTTAKAKVKDAQCRLVIAGPLLRIRISLVR